MLRNGRLGSAEEEGGARSIIVLCKGWGLECWFKGFLFGESLSEACTGLSGSRSKTHTDLHVVVDVDEPGHVRWTLQDEHGVAIARSAPQVHLHSHCPGPAGRQTPTSAGSDLPGTGLTGTRPGVKKQPLHYYLEKWGIGVEVGGA